ncbi:MAG: 23S rRNA (Uracil-5-)-methyltransferase RumA, partial [uncultured bacterium]
IADPPRAGLDDQTRQFILKLKISKIVYVSCNPQTLARDLKDLTKDGTYQIIKIQPIDCFPHTHHIESVTLLQHDYTKDTDYRSMD